MEEIIPTIFVALLGVLLVVPNRGYTRDEMRYLGVAFGLHLAVAIFLPFFSDTVLGGGDMVGYAYHGQQLARAMQRDFFRAFPDVVNLFFQREGAVVEESSQGGSSTGSTSAVTGLIMLFTNGSTYATCMVIGISSYFGKRGLYRVFREVLPESDRPAIAIATLMVPSVLYWTGGIIKEAYVMGPLGCMVYWLWRGFNGRPFVAALVIGACTVFIAMLKPYVLFPFVLAAGVWFYWDRAERAGTAVIFKPIYLVVGIALGAGGIGLLGALFPTYSVDTIAEQTARMQALGEEIGGGSYYEMGDGSDRSLGGQLLYAPLALATSLFRPFIFEVRNGVMLLAALETTALLVIFVRTLWKRSWASTWRAVWASPLLMFSAVFTLLFGVAVGLSTTNMGSLSRYRVPLMPFYVALILALRSQKATVTVEEEPSSEARAAAVVARRKALRSGFARGPGTARVP